MYGEVDRTGWVQRKAKELELRYGRLDGAQLIEVLVRREFPGRIAASASFGAESAVLLDMIAQVDPGLPVFFLDTRKHFGETLHYRDELTRHLGLTNVRTLRPDPDAVAGEDPDSKLWQTDPEACCRLRKTVPLQDALADFDAWITGAKRCHGGRRAHLRTIEATQHRVRINPLAHWSPQDIEARFRDRDLPAHPLGDGGFPSIDCVPCTHRVAAGEQPGARPRDGGERTQRGIEIPRPYHAAAVKRQI